MFYTLQGRNIVRDILNKIPAAQAMNPRINKQYCMTLNTFNTQRKTLPERKAYRIEMLL